LIAQKLQSIRNAGDIIVLVNCKVKEEGTHKELLKQQGLYEHYWHTQQSTHGWTRPKAANHEEIN
jgi:ATP-binding cassette subfamily B protein